MVDIEAIEALYIERNDSLDASSYDILGLCAEIRSLRADRERLDKMEAAAIASSPARPDNRWIFVEGQCDYATWGDVPGAYKTLRDAIDAIEVKP